MSRIKVNKNVKSSDTYLVFNKNVQPVTKFTHLKTLSFKAVKKKL